MRSLSNLGSYPRRRLPLPNELVFMIVDLVSGDPCILYHLMLSSKALYSHAMPILLQKHSLPSSVAWIYHRLLPTRCTSSSPDAIEPCEVDLAVSLLSRIARFRALDELPLVPVRCQTMPYITSPDSFDRIRTDTARFHGNIPFLSAISALGLDSIIEVVLRNGGNPNPVTGAEGYCAISCTGCDGRCVEPYSPLFMALSYGRKTTTSILTEAGAAVSPDVWKFALIEAELATIGSFVTKHPSLPRQPIRTSHYGDIYPVNFTTLSRYTDVVPVLQLLIQHGSPPTSQSSAHDPTTTAFRIALRYNSNDAVRFLAQYATTDDLALLCAGHRFLPLPPFFCLRPFHIQERDDGCLDDCLKAMRLAGLRLPSYSTINKLHKDLCTRIHSTFNPEEVASHGLVVCRALGLREAPLKPAWILGGHDPPFFTPFFIGWRRRLPRCAQPCFSIPLRPKPASVMYIIPYIRRIQAADVMIPIISKIKDTLDLSRYIYSWETPLYVTPVSRYSDQSLDVFKPLPEGGLLGNGWWPLDWSLFEIPSISWAAWIFQSTLYQERVSCRQADIDAFSRYVHQPILIWVFSSREYPGDPGTLSVIP
ncbi:hypothetical protein CLIM01_10713 [Colletotrichum limetticola]|uniref:Ankyrin n=1 Tax=Colletotrichum limetticola TaxID=1209924 RepID=A0ABQ9PIP7_9PEZI|nr:hypothetical protein CLIM01_10713 [Colletotrichum limetticola]